MEKYKISFVSGHTLTLKNVEVEADGMQKAIEKAFEDEGKYFENRLVSATQISDSIVGSEESKSQEDGEKMLAGNFFTDLYVKDKFSGEVHRVGDDVHDSLTVDDFGTVHYYNMQNGDGCGANSKKNITLKEKYPETDWGNRANELVYGYEFVPCPKECYLCEYKENCRSVRK